MRDNDIHIRTAEESDIPAITRIYNHAIEHTTSTFDIKTKTVEDRLQWFCHFSGDYPLLVATINNEVAGFGYILPFGTRMAYKYTVENVVYVDCEQQRRGIGSALLSRLIDIASEKSYHVIIALIVEGNDASLALHRKHAFEQVGLMREVGYKFDLWLDVIVMEKILDI